MKLSLALRPAFHSSSHSPSRSNLRSPIRAQCPASPSSPTPPPSPCQTPAIAPLAPLIGLTTLLATLHVFRAPIASRALSWYLGAHVRVRRVTLRPFSRAATLQGVHVADRRGLPMLSLAGLSVGRGAAGEKKGYVVKLDRPEVVCCFDQGLRETNWGRWAGRFRGGTAASAPAPETSPEAGGGPGVKLDVSGGMLLSLRYAGSHAAGQRIINDVRLTELDGIGEDLLSPGSTAVLVEGLCSRAIRQASWMRFDSAEARRDARRFARSAWRRETRGMRALARVHVRRLRKNVRLADELLKGIPDMEGFAETARQGGVVLGHLERWLGLLGGGEGGRDESEREDGERRDEGVRGERASESVSPKDNLNLPAAQGNSIEQAGRIPPVNVAPPVLTEAPAREYLELDESNLTN